MVRRATETRHEVPSAQPHQLDVLIYERFFYLTYTVQMNLSTFVMN